MTTRVLVVDDTDHVRTMLVDILRLHGFDVVGQAANGNDAVTRVGELSPDIIVMDYKMPGIDGVETSRQIREVVDDQRIILYSAFIDGQLRDRARDVGVAVCIPKGAGVEALATEISALVMDLGEDGNAQSR